MPNRCLALLAFLLLAACTDATGKVSGGEQLITVEAGGPATWTALYKDLFGPSGQASCSAQSTCHVSCTTASGMLGGFICTSQELCWQGMTGQTVPDGGAVSDAAGPETSVTDGAADATVADASATDAGDAGVVDAGGAGEAGVAGYCGTVPPIISNGLPPTQMQLYLSLHQASSSSDNKLCSDGNKTVIYDCNMPCGGPAPDGGPGGCQQQNATHTFTQDDLSRIATWIQQGAQYN